MEDKAFIPNVQWMSEKYDEMNEKLFGGALGGCYFGVFTTGKGSQGSVLGWFKITNKNVRVDRHTRRMFVENGWFDRVYVDRDNFVEVCRPKIELNGNYSGTEHGFLATLVHEMCHYYNYMYGYVPKQGHGTEFRNIAYTVSIKSNGMFTIQRLASAEQMNELALNDKMQAIRDKRLEKKKSSITAVFVFKTNGEIQLTTTSNDDVIGEITASHYKKDVLKVATSNDMNLIEMLFSRGYKKNFRTWRYWNVENKNWISQLSNYDMKEYLNPMYSEKEVKKYIFTVKTSNGIRKFEYNGEQEDLKDKLKMAFPNMKDETLERIMSNKANYRISENNGRLTRIIKETIDEFIESQIGGDDNDYIEISPHMNLGLYSPFEVE